MKNIIITGLPRSGTTLICHLLNTVEDTVALHEPMSGRQQGSKNDLCDKVSQFFDQTRQTALQHKKILATNVKGEMPDNIMGDRLNTDGLRQHIEGIKTSYINVEKALTANFTLCVKHNAFFTALLDSLINNFDCYAVIRNPLAVLASWNSVDLPVNRGYIPAAERLDKQLASQLKKIPDRIDRQLHILIWFYQQYQLLPPQNIIRYEDVILSGGASLNAIVPNASILSEPLNHKNNNELYDEKIKKMLVKKLADSGIGEKFPQFYEIQ